MWRFELCEKFSIGTKKTDKQASYPILGNSIEIHALFFTLHRIGPLRMDTTGVWISNYPALSHFSTWIGLVLWECFQQITIPYCLYFSPCIGLVLWDCFQQIRGYLTIPQCLISHLELDWSFYPTLPLFLVLYRIVPLRMVLADWMSYSSMYKVESLLGNPSMLNPGLKLRSCTASIPGDLHNLETDNYCNCPNKIYLYVPLIFCILFICYHIINLPILAWWNVLKIINS